MPQPPSGTVTFLFTDIEGSTRLWERHLDAMEDALACHDAILRNAIGSHGGYVFATGGDAFCAAFSTPTDALVAAHPECTERVLALADHIGSTSSILNFVTGSPRQEFIIVTEPGIIHQMEKRCPEKTFIAAPATGECACNECPYMKLNTLEKVYLCMRDRQPVVDVEESIRVRALEPIDRMLEITARAAAA